MNRKEKQQARAERYEELVRKAETQSTQAWEKSHEMVSHIPMGQPILVGHHSERGHRRLLDRSWNKMGESVKLGEKADYYRQKAEAAANNDAIYTGDDDAEERLKEKIAKLEQLQEQMKTANKIIRNKKTTEQEKVAQLQELGISETNAKELLNPDRFEGLGFASFSLQNNGACIRTAKLRLEKVIALKNAETKEYEINGVKVVENTEENRLQLFFNGKPSEEIRSKLKHNAFRWSPSNVCWQSYLNRWQISQAKTLLNEL